MLPTTFYFAMLTAAATNHSLPLLTLYDFKSAATSGRWRCVNDSVMGGVSRGEVRHLEEAGCLEFFGQLSLENRGGFASVRSVGSPRDISRFAGVVVRIRGDGRRYLFNIHTDQTPFGGSYRLELPTVANTWTTVRLPFTAFRATYHGRLIPGAPQLNRSHVRAVGVTLADKRAGPFRLQVDWIKAYSQTDPEPSSVRGETDDAPK